MTKPPKARVPPHNFEAEQVLLSSILQKNRVIKTVADITTDDFYRESHRLIFSAMLDLHEDGEEIDLATLKGYLDKDGTFEKVGGVDYIVSLYEAHGTAAGAPSYAKMIKDCSIKRAIITGSHQIIESAFTETYDSSTLRQDIFDLAESLHSPIIKKGKLSVELKRFVEQQDGHFFLTEIYKHMGIYDKNDKNAVSQAMGRMVKSGKIERFGGKSGCFRKIDHEAEVIDWKSDNGKPLDIRYPLGIERFFHTMSKNIILLAGSADSGKTAMLLNFVQLNMDRHNVWYFSSEMGAMELKSRLIQFDDPIDDWNFEARERADNFSDVIRPDDINVIDFLEISDNFWQIGQKITDIWKRLNKGIAVIALQKDSKAKLGRGADFTRERPRLYLTLDKNYPHGQICKIVKAKNWRDPEVNPNGYFHKFKIVKGCVLLPSAWEVDYE